MASAIEFLESSTGVDVELLDKPMTHPANGAERVCLASERCVRPNQLLVNQRSGAGPPRAQVPDRNPPITWQ